ncbi:MAG: neutral zinc metallopeptidase [Hyphomicrobium sp.]
MRYDENDRESKNVEDRRGQGGGGFGFPGGGIQIPIGGKGGFSLTTLLILGAIMLLFGINPLDVLLGGQGGNFPQVPQMPSQERQVERRDTGASDNPFNIPGLPGSREQKQGDAGTQGPKHPTGDDAGVFVKRVLADTEDVWGRVFQSFGQRYKEPQLVMFTGGTRTGCGTGMTQMGPFYCPLDQKIYIDTAFYDELARRFNAPGDFAQAYVVAHEVGHHVQTLLGIAGKVQELKEQSDERTSNQIQVRMELQADCLAGVWANITDQMKSRLQEGDIDEGLRAANAIGDDMIQKKTQGHVVPDAFTHGTAAQRMRWFTTGFKSGEMGQCDTFNARSL